MFSPSCGNDRVQDVFGVVWDRGVDENIGNVVGQVLSQPTLAGYQLPEPVDHRRICRRPGRIARFPGPLPRVPDRLLAVRTGVDPCLAWNH